MSLFTVRSTTDYDNMFTSTDCLLMNGQAGQLSWRIFEQDGDGITSERRAEHPQFELPHKRSQAFNQQSLHKVFTTNVTTACSTNSTVQFYYVAAAATTSTSNLTWYLADSASSSRWSASGHNHGWDWSGYVERESPEEKEIKLKANNKADELLRKWLSEAEYNYLKENKELELSSQYEKDVVYIVKKDVNRKVVKKVNGVAKQELCVMPVDVNLVNDDGLLSKILLLKTDEKEFLKVANVYPV